jgi:hypothetical protein
MRVFSLEFSHFSPFSALPAQEAKHTSTKGRLNYDLYFGRDMVEELFR